MYVVMPRACPGIGVVTCTWYEGGNTLRHNVIFGVCGGHGKLMNFSWLPVLPVVHVGVKVLLLVNGNIGFSINCEV